MKMVYGDLDEGEVDCMMQWVIKLAKVYKVSAVQYIGTSNFLRLLNMLPKVFPRSLCFTMVSRTSIPFPVAPSRCSPRYTMRLVMGIERLRFRGRIIVCPSRVAVRSIMTRKDQGGGTIANLRR